MKKIFTLIAAVMMAVGASAQEIVEIPLENAEKWSAGWEADVTFNDGIVSCSIHDNQYGAAGLWLGNEDWSGYSSLTVVMESFSSGWGQIIVKDVNDKEITAGLGQTATQKSFSIDLSKLEANVKQVCFQSAPNGVFSFSRVYLTPKVEYDEPKELTPDEYNNIYSSQFVGLSDFAKIVFTYTTEGELVKNDGSGDSVVGWGTGALQSCTGQNICNINLKALGDNELSFVFSELKPYLDMGPSQYNTYGLNWYFYAQGKATTKMKKVVAYQVKGFNGEGYKDPAVTNAIQTVETKSQNSGVMYNIAGQRVQNAKGIVIKNGKKFVF